MRKVLIAAAAFAFLSVPLVAGAQGVQADGWEARLDFEADIDSVLSFMNMGGGVHVTTTGAGFAIFWQPGSTAEGDFSISATFTQMEESDRRERLRPVLGAVPTCRVPISSTRTSCSARAASS